MDNFNFVKWSPKTIVNKQIQEQENITNNWKYRQYIQHNAKKIIKYNTLNYN
jgi:hypothetical protein